MYQPLAQKEVIANQAKKIYELEQALATAKARNHHQPRWQTYQEDRNTTDRFLACTLAFMALSAVLLLSDHSSLTALRTLSINLGGGQCLWTKAVALAADADVPRTLLVSYPGSGKRYVWRAVEGLTGFRVGDGKLLQLAPYERIPWGAVMTSLQAYLILVYLMFTFTQFICLSPLLPLCC